MRRHILRALSAAAALGGAVLMTAGLAMPSIAGAATAAKAAPGAVVATSSQGGYVTGGGRHFRFIQTTVQVSPPRAVSQFAAVVLGGRGVTPVYLAVKAGGGANSVGWSVGTLPFHMGGAPMTHLAPAPGDLLRMSIYFDRLGHVFFTAVDTTKGVSETVRVPVPASTLYLAAEAAVFEFGYGAPVATDFRLWSFTKCQVTTYSGIKGTMLGPWITNKLVAVNSSGAVVMGPSVLFNSGADFNVLRR